MWFCFFLMRLGSSELGIIEDLAASKDLVLLDVVEERVLWGRSQAIHLARNQVKKRLQKRAQEIGGDFLHISYIKSSASHAEGRAWIFAEELNGDNVDFLARKHLERLDVELVDVVSFYRDHNQIYISAFVETDDGKKVLKLTIDSQTSKLENYTFASTSF